MIQEGTPISYGAFADAITRAGKEFAFYEVQAPGTVAVKIRNLANCWVATLALQAQGYTTICVRSLDVLESLNVKNLTAILVSADEYKVLERFDSVPIFVVSSPEFNSAAPLELRPCAEITDECGHILYTSGTTGTYKKIFMHARKQLEADQERCRYQRYSGSTRYHGLGFGLWTALGYKQPPAVWSVGGVAIFEQRADWHEHFIASGFTSATILPDQALKISEYEHLERLDAGVCGRQEIIIAGGFISPKVAVKLSQFFKVSILYGCTEIIVGVLGQDFQALEDVSWMTLKGSRVVEVEGARQQVSAINEEGRLRIKLTETDPQGYMDKTEGSNDAFSGGYFYPGDLAVQREDGRFRILGRTADVVNLGGQKLAVAPIEANLQSIFQVDYVCLFSGTDSFGEPESVIAIEAAVPPDEERLNHVGQEFSQWGNVRFAFVDPFPRTHSGTSKIDRKRLRDIVFPK